MILRKRVILILVAAVIVAITAITLFVRYMNVTNQQILHLTPEQRLADFDTLCSILDESYPFWAEVESANIDKTAVFNEYRKSTQKASTDIAFFKEIQFFLKEFKGCGHLGVLDGSLYKRYSDAFIAGAALYTEHEAQKIQPLNDVVFNPTSRSTYSLLDQSHDGFRSTIGLKNIYTKPDEANNSNAKTITTKVMDGQTAYISIPNFLLENYEADAATLSSFFEENKALPNLIIDLRGNGGGSDLYWKELLVAPNAAQNLASERYFLFNMNDTTEDYVLANLPQNAVLDAAQLAKEEPLFTKAADFSHYTMQETAFTPAADPYAGKVWVLVDERVYSAAENFVAFCKNSGFATIVGTTTGGDGGVADPILVSLPNSGLIVRYSVFYGLNPDGTSNVAIGTTPDVAVNVGEDALEKCMELL